MYCCVSIVHIRQYLQVKMHRIDLKKIHPFLAKFKRGIMLLAVFMVGVFLMFYRIDRYPLSIGIYEGITGLSAMKVIEGDSKHIMVLWEKPIRKQRGGGSGVASCEFNPLLIYPTALFFTLFGQDRYHVILRLTPIIYGLLSILGLYVLARRLFGSMVGLTAAFILATSTWALIYSRVAIDLSQVVFLSLSCLCLYVVLKPSYPAGFLLLGGITSLSTYGYVAARVIFPLLVLDMVLCMAVKRGYAKSHWQSLIVLLGGFWLGLLLQGAHLADFFQTNVPMSFGTWHEQASAPFWQRTTENLAALYGRFFREWSWNTAIVTERGASLDPVTGICFAVGALWSLVKIKTHAYRLLILWVIAAVLPCVISTNAEYRRAILAAPAVYALAAVGIGRIFSLPALLIRNRWGTIINKGGIITVVLVIAYLNLDHYFGLYSKAASDPGNVYAIWREQRARLMELMEGGKVYTDIFRADYGWPQTIEYEARIRGYEDRYILLDPGRAKKSFSGDDGAHALYLSREGVTLKKETVN